MPQPTKANWVDLLFPRHLLSSARSSGTKAEADLKKALELFPEQPHVLNYLGYSWIDQGTNLDAGMDMIKRAVAARPDDGYIVNSLGWAYFRLGNYEEATKQLERAIELKPEDPTINDHLGDAYWQGRPHARSQIPVGACARPQARRRGTAEDPGKAEERAARGDVLAGGCDAAEEGPERRLRCRLSKRAPAKINLTLRVAGSRADGYHTLESLVAFAALGDDLDAGAWR